MAKESTTPDASAASKQSGDTVDWQAKYQELQATHSQQGQELARLSGELDALKPFVTFGPQTDPHAEAESEYDPNDPEQVVDHKIHTAVSKVKGDYDARLASMEFLMDNPDLKEHADLVAIHLNKQDPRKPIKVRLREAAKATRDRVAKLNEQAIERHKRAQAEEAKKKAPADGVMTGHQTTPTDSGDNEDSFEDYAAERRRMEAEILGTG